MTCPTCGNDDWDVLRAARRRPALRVCRRCGAPEPVFDEQRRRHLSPQPRRRHFLHRIGFGRRRAFRKGPLEPRQAAVIVGRPSTEAVRHAPFTLYGLPPEQPANRWVAGFGEDWVALAHDSGEARLEVETSRHHRRRKRRGADVTLAVNGRPTPFRVSWSGERWTGQAEVGELVVRVDGEGLPPENVELVVVTDVEPYC